jgi:branched-chain amino acid transport system ATP-binding protein
MKMSNVAQRGAGAQADSSPRDPVLSARGLGKTFGAFDAVKGVNIDVNHGEIHALIGPNGAGKTTVFNLLTNFLKPTAGTIRLMGEDVTALSSARLARMGMVRSFQISAVFPHLTVIENLRVALQRPAGLGYQFWRPLSALHGLDGRAMELIEGVGLEEFRDTEAANLSYGRKRVLEIATTLALDPKVLLLDEPMAGMGHEDVVRVADIVREIARNCAVLMVEHNLGVVADLCNRVTVLQRGEILTTGAYADVSRDPRVREAYMGVEDE